MFPILQRPLGQLIVSPYWSNDGHCINLGRSQNVVFVRRKSDRRESLLQSFFAFRITVGNQNYFRIVQAVEIPNDIRTPITVTNHTDTHSGTP